MKMIQTALAGQETIPAPSKKHAFPDLVPNVNFQDAMIRFGFTLVIPMVMLGIDKYLIIYTAPIMAYLFVTAIAHFCVIKYVWHRYIKQEAAPSPAAYGKDPAYPEESLN
jgi:hypothetical protein